MEQVNVIQVSRKRTGSLVLMLLAAAAIIVAGCKKDAAESAIDTDANGYMCMKCSAKFYTSRKVFMEPKCPKCQQFAIEEVVGYVCEKDQHLTLRPRVSGPEGASVCEQCGAHLSNAMVRPHEKDLKAWGATKTAPQ